jgi:hypothetical protein
MARNQIEFTVATTPIARHDDKAATFQERRGSIFAGIAGVPARGHYG